MFRASTMGEVQGRAGAKLIGEVLSKKKVALITLKNDFGQALAAGFKEARPSSASRSPANTSTACRIASSAR